MKQRLPDCTLARGREATLTTGPRSSYIGGIPVPRTRWSFVMADPIIPEFHYAPQHDTNDDKEWSEMDFEDLQNTLARGGSIEDVAIFPCRRGGWSRARRRPGGRIRRAQPCRRTAGRAAHVLHGGGLPSRRRFHRECCPCTILPLRHSRFRRHRGGVAGPLRAATAPLCLRTGPRPDAGVGRCGDRRLLGLCGLMKGVM